MQFSQSPVHCTILPRRYTGYTVHMPPGHEYPIAPPPIEEQAEVAVEKKSLLKRHPYVDVAIGALALLFLVLLIVAARSGVSGSDMGDNWVGAGGVFFTGGRNLNQADRISAEQVIKDRSPDTELGYIPIAIPSADGGVDEDFANDLGKLLGQLTQGAEQPAEPDPNTSSAFSFIPQGLISVATGARQPTKEAEELFTYGNEIGSYIQGYESLHLNAAQTLKDHAEDRTNPQKTELVDRLGYDMAALGRDFLQMQTVPQDIRAAHAAYATSYRIAGTNLTKIATTKTDEEYLDAIAAYNASVESLSKRFLILVGFFSAHNVVFSSSDPGSIFMFTPTISF